MLKPDPIECRRLLAIAEDIEDFQHITSSNVTNAQVRRMSGALRRLLVENAAGNAWRALGFTKSPTLSGPDLIGLCAKQNLDPAMAIAVVAPGLNYFETEFAFLGAFRVDNPSTGIPASADSGFAVMSTSIARDARTPATVSEFDPLIGKCWFLEQYLAAPGLIRMGQTVSRREIIKHVANDMGGVHIDIGSVLSSAHQQGPNRPALIQSEDKVFIETPSGKIDGLYIEVLGIAQAVGRSQDFQKLAAEIRKTCG